MRCIRNITEDLVWVGVNNRRLMLFEGVYDAPKGVSYNSYLLLDEKTVLFDTVDEAVRGRFMENLSFALNGRELDYLVIQHVEPDHAAAIKDVLAAYPKVALVGSEKTRAVLSRFIRNATLNFYIIDEKSLLITGRHSLRFVFTPMVHWPEVLMTYDETDKILFSADAFGAFGATNGALFADEVNFEVEYMDEARRYYANIVGKYGAQTQSALKKLSGLEIKFICPLHSFIWRKDFEKILSKYDKWSKYEPEEKGVLIAYASVYGNTENAAEFLALRLSEKGARVRMFDASVTPASYIIAEAFRMSALVLASTTYNMGIFITMEELIRDMIAHNIQKRAVAFIENGSWALTAGKLMQKEFENAKNINFIENVLTIDSSLKDEQVSDIEKLANEIIARV